MSDKTEQIVFRCHCGATRIYGEGPCSIQTTTNRPRIRCSNPDHPGLHLHEYIGHKAATWVDYVGGKDEFKKIPVKA
jgi:hypothetical protein